jgi:hypothetical protein
MKVSNPDIPNNAKINTSGSHTAQFGTSSTSVGGRRRHKRIRTRRIRTRKTRTRRPRTRRHRKRKQHGGLNPTYRSYSASFDPGKNGMYANGPSVGKILEQFN